MRKNWVVTSPIKATGKKITNSSLVAALKRMSIKPATQTAAKVKTTFRKKNKTNMGKVYKGVGGLPSFSGFSLSNKPTKSLLAKKRVGAPNYQITNFSQQIVNPEGFQNAVVFRHNSQDFLQSILARVPGSTAPNVTQYVLESNKLECYMTNSSLATQYVDIYDVIRKRDCGSGGISGPTGDPLWAWKYGVSDQSEAPPDMTAWSHVQSRPTDSRLFNDYFKIVKRTKIGLVAGATHKHSVSLKTNMLIDSEMLRRAEGDLRGVAVYTMIVINGQPVSVPQESGAIVTTATTALDCVWAARAKYTWISDNKVAWYINDSLFSLKGEQITQPSLGSFVTNTVV